MRRNRDHVALRRVEAEAENTNLLPQIDSFRNKAKELQKNLEGIGLGVGREGVSSGKVA